MRADIPYPQNGWTVDQFLATAQQLTHRQGPETTQWGYLPLLPTYSPLLAAQLNEPAGRVHAPRFTDADVADGFRWMAALFNEHLVTPWLPIYQGSSNDLNQLRNLLEGGQVAMWMGSNISLDAQQELVGNLGAVTAPEGAAGLFAEPVVLGYSISAATQQPDAAWKLVRFLSLQTQTNDANRYAMPARRSSVETTDFASRLPSDVWEAVQYSAENSQPIRLWQEMWDARGVLASMIDDGLTAEQALTRLDPGTSPANDEPLVMATPIPTPESAVTTIRFAMYNSYAARRLAEEFNADHPNLNVVVSDAPLDVAPEAFRNYDCYSEIHYITEDGFDHVLPIDSFMELDPTISETDFYPVTWESVTANGQRYGLPHSANLPMIVYDKAKLAAAGLSDPNPYWTTEEFVAVVQALTEGEGVDKQYGFADQLTNILGDEPSLLRMFGISFANPSLTPITFNYAAAAPALRWYVELTTLYEVMYTVPVVGSDYVDPYDSTYPDNMAARNVAMLGTVGAFANDIESLMELNQGVVPLPVGPSGYSGSQRVVMDNLYINSETEHPQACWQWISFLSQHLDPVFAIPARIAVAESEAFEARMSPEIAAVYRAGLEARSSAPAQPGSRWEENWLVPGWLWLRRARDRAIQGEDLLAELALSQEQWDSYRECVIAVNGFEDQAKWIACAVEVDPKQQAWYDFYYATDAND
jgi:ABC-type glycerol-3-phosphate transport system substrate-binding protein